MEPDIVTHVTASEIDADPVNKERWAQALVKNVAAVTVAFRGAGDQRHAARRTYLQLAPEARTDTYLEVIDEVLYQSVALTRLTRNARMAVARRAHIVEFQAGEALCIRGMPQDALMVIMSGEVEVVEGHWDVSATPPPGQASRVRGAPSPAPQPHFQPHPPSQNQLASHYSSRRHLTEQLSMASSSGTAITTTTTSSGATPHTHPQPPPHPLATHPLKLEMRHTVHPALQSHPSARRHVNHNTHNHKHNFVPNVRASVRHSGWRNGNENGAYGGGESPAGSGNGGGGSVGPILLVRGDSLGAVDMGWLSRLPSCVAAAALEELPAGPAITSRALLATKAEMAAGGLLSGLAGGPGGPSGYQGSLRRSSISGGCVGGAAANGSAGGAFGFRNTNLGEGHREEDGDGTAAVERCFGGGVSGGGNGVDALQRLRWPYTAVAVRGPVECAAIGLQQLCAVLATEMHWDVEVMVESLEELPVFAALSATELRQLVRVLRLHTFSGGSVVYKQNSVGNDLFIIRSGCVRLLKQVALDDSARNRLNRISAELTTVRDQTAAAAAALHGQYGTSVAPFGCSAGFSPVAPLNTPGAGGGGSGGCGVVRSAALASLSGSVSPPSSPSPGRLRRLSQSQVLTHGPGGGGLGSSLSGGWPGNGRNGVAPDGHRDILHSHQSAAAAIQNLINRGPGSITAPLPSLIKDRTPQRLPPSFTASARASISGAPSAPHSPPFSGTDYGSSARCASLTAGQGPGGLGAEAGVGAGRRGRECAPRAHSGSHANTRDAFFRSCAPADGLIRRHSATTPVVPGSSLGPPYNGIHTTPHSPGLPMPPQKGPTGNGGDCGRGQNLRRKRGNHAEALDKLVVVPQLIGERTEGDNEDLVSLGPASAAADSGELRYGSSDSDGGCIAADAPSSPMGLPPVPSSRLPSSSQLQSGWAAAPAPAPASSPAALPVWQARAPRQLGSDQEMVFVEMGTLTAGQCFGEVRSDGVAVRSCSAVCDTRTEVLTISRNELHQRMGGRAFEYLWSQVPSDGPQSSLDPSLDAGHCAQQLERSMQWTLFKQKLVAEVLTQKDQRRRTALKCR